MLKGWRPVRRMSSGCRGTCSRDRRTTVWNVSDLLMAACCFGQRNLKGKGKRRRDARAHQGLPHKIPPARMQTVLQDALTVLQDALTQLSGVSASRGSIP